MPNTTYLSRDNDLRQSLAFSVQENEALCRNKSRHQIREHFLWEFSNEAKAELSSDPNTLEESIYLSSPRYRFFIFIDNGVLDSVLGKNREGRRGTPPAYVLVVNVEWPIDFNTEHDSHFCLQEPTQAEIHNDHDIFVRVFPDHLYPTFYEDMSDMNSWYRVYVRPPRVVNGSLLDIL